MADYYVLVEFRGGPRHLMIDAVPRPLPPIWMVPVYDHRPAPFESEQDLPPPLPPRTTAYHLVRLVDPKTGRVLLRYDHHSLCGDPRLN